ncbi:hypothetical protein B566_EDAN003705 [Ephemera danica]|nr:hypothetical protein B566_EDAN003705 [Ephemera danica]
MRTCCGPDDLSTMYNLNVNVTTSASSLAVEPSCTTPKTPEILNSLIAMSNPFDSYTHHAAPHLAHMGGGPRVASSPTGGEVFAHPGTCSSSSSASSVSSLCMPPPSIQHTCSQLIKEGLKLTIQSKRKQSPDPSLSLGEPPNFCKIPKLQFTPPAGGGCGNGVGSSGDDEVSHCSSPEAPWLTAEDAERRRRRRERNKIAATKCRLKKRERTVNLVQESEVLETQNHEFKSQIQDLETQRRRLMDMLAMHNQTCVKHVASSGHYVQQQQQQSDHHSHQFVDSFQMYTTSPQESPPGFADVYASTSVHQQTQQQQQQAGMQDSAGCLA